MWHLDTIILKSYVLGNSWKFSAGVFPDVADVQNLLSKYSFFAKSTEGNFTIARNLTFLEVVKSMINGAFLLL